LPWSSFNLTSKELSVLSDSSIVGILILKSEFELSNIDVQQPKGKIGSQTTTFLDFVDLQS